MQRMLRMGRTNLLAVRYRSDRYIPHLRHRNSVLLRTRKRNLREAIAAN
jgi:hypothetical protein